MRIYLLLVVGALLLLVSALSGEFKSEAKDPVGGKSKSYVAHEWGTFTSMQGSNGVTLDGLHHEEEALPEFVYSLGKAREDFNAGVFDQARKGLGRSPVRVNNKMETPVIYFYSDTPQKIKTRVCFNGGLLTQWYPAARSFGPTDLWGGKDPIDMAAVKQSFLQWDVDLLAKGDSKDKLPKVDKDDPWQFARIPDSNLVRTNRDTFTSSGAKDVESFLFYRGLGALDIPVKAKTSAGGKIEIQNNCKDELKHLFVLNVHGHQASYSYLPSIAAGKTQQVVKVSSTEDPNLKNVVEKLRKELSSRLVEEGLTADEATAMTKTWEKSYFHTEGLRILYVVPRSLVDEILPVAFEPAPKKFVRVLVGRLECITPEAEGRVLQALKDVGSSNALEQMNGQKVLHDLGRFLEPHLRRVLTLTNDAELTARANSMIVNGLK